MGLHRYTTERGFLVGERSRREKYVFRSLVAATGLGAVALTGAAVDAGVHAWHHNHPPTPQGSRIIPSASSSPTPASSLPATPSSPSRKPSTHPDTKPKPSATPEVPLGTPLSYTLHMKGGSVKKVKLLPMSCPPDCERTPVPGNPNAMKIKLIPPETYEGWRNVYYYADDPRLILAHSTEIPANADFFAGQYFKNIKKGDELDLKTTTGEHEYVAEAIATPSKGTLDFNKSVQALGKDDLLFTTCAVPNDDYNVIIEFVPETAKPESATSTRLSTAAVSWLALSASNLQPPA